MERARTDKAHHRCHTSLHRLIIPAMRKTRFTSRCVAATALAVTALPAIPQTPDPAPPAIFTAATQQRAEALLGKMTMDEKVGQLTQLFVFAPNADVDARIRGGRLGSALFVTDPKEINRLQHLAVEGSRLHIPLIFGFDVIHGFRTIFPVPIAMAASWDPGMIEHAQGIAADEASSVGIRWSFAPMLDIARDPRWGRMVEGAGEDPYLGAAIARAQVRGFQGPAIGTPDRVLACAKHFAGYGAAEGGRDYDASYISDAQMQNVYLLPFHAAVEAGVGSLMSAYMDLNDVPATGNAFLLDQTLRRDWGFRGFVVSDANAVKSLVNHGFAQDPEDAAVRALTAGVNMEMAIGDPAYDHLEQALVQHRITAAEVDKAVLPILEAKIQLGLFEHPYADVERSEKVLTDPAHREAALDAAERSAVLLRNQGNLLPLSKTAYKSVAVIGPINDALDEVGPWTFVQKNSETVTLAAGLHNELGNGVKVQTAQGVQIDRYFPSMFNQIFHITPPPAWSADEAKHQFDQAVAVAKQSDLVVMTLGEHWNMAGEQASESTLALPGDQQKLLEAVVALGKPTVLVLTNGRPLDITWATEHVPAILDAWYPGTRGGDAVARLLFGDATPGGHLPFAWPHDVGQVPINFAHNLTQDAAKQSERYWNEPATALFPFGYGLTYATVTFSNLRIDNQSVAIDQPLHVTLDIANTGGHEADEVAQLYIHQQWGRASRPVRELKGFQRVHLTPHAQQTLHFTLDPQELRYWSAADHGWMQDASDFDLWIGSDSAATLHTTFHRTK